MNRGLLSRSPAHIPLTCRSLEALSLINPYAALRALVSFVASPLHPAFRSLPLSSSSAPLFPRDYDYTSWTRHPTPSRGAFLGLLLGVRTAITRSLVPIQGINEPARGVAAFAGFIGNLSGSCRGDMYGPCGMIFQGQILRADVRRVVIHSRGMRRGTNDLRDFNNRIK